MNETVSYNGEILGVFKYETPIRKVVLVNNNLEQIAGVSEKTTLEFGEFPKKLLFVAENLEGLITLLGRNSSDILSLESDGGSNEKETYADLKKRLVDKVSAFYSSPEEFAGRSISSEEMERLGLK